MDMEAIRQQRDEFLARVPYSERAKVRVALEKLIAFSLKHEDKLDLAPVGKLEQQSIGFDVAPGIMLWKAYAKEQKLEVLARSVRQLSDERYDEFRALWRAIPGKKDSLPTLGKVPDITLKALESDHVWTPLVDCMEWALEALGKSRN